MVDSILQHGSQEVNSSAHEFSALDTKPGVFPWRGACGFYPPDVVGRDRSLKLTDGQKRIYERLVRYAGRNGVCWPAQTTLSDEMGKSVRQVISDLDRLRKVGLISWEKRSDHRRVNRYHFPRHPIFDVQPTACQREPEETDVTCSPLHVTQAPGTPDCTSRHAVQGNLTCSPLHTNSVQNSAQEKSSSSSVELGEDEEEERRSFGDDDHPEEELEGFAVFLQGLLAAGQDRGEEEPPTPPRYQLLEISRAAPGWSVPQIATAIRDAGRIRPRSPAYFVPMVRDLYAKRKGIAPATVRPFPEKPAAQAAPPPKRILAAEDPTDAWFRIKQELRRKITPEGFQNWFADTRLSRIDGNTLHVAVPNEATKLWIEEEYQQHTTWAIETLGIPVDSIRYELDSGATGEPARRSVGSAVAKAHIASDAFSRRL